MPDLTTTFEVPADPDAVFNALTDLPGYSRWLVIHQYWVDDTLPDPVEAGSTFTQRVKVSGIPGQVNWNVDVAKAPTRFGLSGRHSRGSDLVLSWDIEEAAGRSIVHFHGGMTGVPRPLQSIVSKQFREAIEMSHDKLRDLLGA